MSWARDIFGPAARTKTQKDDWSLPADFVEKMKGSTGQIIPALLPREPLPSLTLGTLHVSDPSSRPLDELLAGYKPGCPPRRIFSLLDAAWAVDPTLVVKIIFHARSISQGLGWKEGFYRGMGWLLHLLVAPVCETRDKDGEVVWRSHGTWKDLTDLIILCLNDQLSVNLSKGHARNLDALDGALGPKSQRRVFKEDRQKSTWSTPRNREKYGVMSHLGAQPPRGFRARLWSATSKHVRHTLLYGRLAEALAKDAKFQALYLTVLDLYVKQLQADLDLLKQHKEYLRLPASQREAHGAEGSPFLSKISLAAKWAPTPKHAVDKQTWFSTALAIKFFPSATVNQARHDLKVFVLSPLRDALGVLERRLQMHGSINYAKAGVYLYMLRLHLITQLPEASLRQNAHHLMKHDKRAFSRYVEGRLASSGAQAILPYRMILGAVCDDKLSNTTASVGWDVLLQRMKRNMPATFMKTVIIADPSGSMGSLLSKGTSAQAEPIHHALGFYLLFSQLSPKLHRTGYTPSKIFPNSFSDDISLPLRERIHAVRNANSHASIKVADILEAAWHRPSLVSSWLESPRTLMVLTNKDPDLTFGSAQLSDALAALKQRFSKVRAAGPQIVWWNLRHQTQAITEQSMDGFKLISGWNDEFIAEMLGLHLSAPEPSGEEKLEEEDEEELMNTKKERTKGASTIAEVAEKACFQGLAVRS